jgi:hypothetical protein
MGNSIEKVLAISLRARFRASSNNLLTIATVSLWMAYLDDFIPRTLRLYTFYESPYLLQG